MTERVPQQRNRFAQRRAEADQVPAVTEKAVNKKSTAPENAAFDGDKVVFDESFVAAAPVRELSAADRALQRHLLPDQRTGEAPLPITPPRWSVRPSHRFTAIRPLPAVAAAVCILAVAAFLAILLW